MGLAVAATSVPTKTIRSDAVDEMAPALTEPLSQSKLSSSAASGASPRTSSSTTTTATVTATLGGTTLLPSADEILSEPLQELQQHQVVEEEVVVEENVSEHFPEVFTEVVTTGSPVNSSATLLHEVSAEKVVKEGEVGGSGISVAMGMALPVTSGDGGGTTVDDIQNNNNTTSGGAGQVMKQLEPDINRDLVEIALEQMHQDAVIAGDGLDGVTALDTIAAAVVDMQGTLAAASASGGVPANMLQQAQPQQQQQQQLLQQPDFVLMDLNNAPVILAQPAFQDQQQQQPLQPMGVGVMSMQQHDLSQSSTSSLGGVGSGELGALMKESAEMDQMMHELSTVDIDLLQVLKSFDTNNLLLFSDVDVANLCEGGTVDGRDPHALPSSSSPSASPSKDRERLELHDQISKRQTQMQRKYDFLVRRLNKIQARYMGQHVSEEVAGLFEHTQRFWKKREKEHTKQLHNNNNSGGTGGQPGSTSSMTAGAGASASEKWPDVIPFQAPPPDVTPIPPERLKPISANALKTFTKRMEGISTTVCSVQSNVVLRSRYFQGVNVASATGKPDAPTGPSSQFGTGFHAAKSAPVPPVTGSSSVSGANAARIGYANISNTIPPFERAATQELEQTAGMLHAELRHVQANFDSDATLSSSGGDSADESVPFVNAAQEPRTIAERALWKWSKDRAAVASRWTWLMARIADLEYRIRQHNEVLNKIRANKGAVAFEEQLVTDGGGGGLQEQQSQQLPQSINGYRGQLPGSSKPLATSDPSALVTTDEEDDAMGSCSRARPYCRLRFRKRKLVQTQNLHTVSKRAARPSNFKCGCQWPLQPCALCTGRQDPTAPRDPPDTMPYAERVALVDSCYHSVLSFPEDVSHSVHLEAVMRLPEWQNKMIRSTTVAVSGGSSASHKGRGHSNSTFFSSGDETVPSSHGRRYTGSDGKRKFVGGNKNNIVDSGNKYKKAKTKRDGGHPNNRKHGYPSDSARIGPNGHHIRSQRNKSRKSSHCYEYYDAHDGGVSRSKNSSPNHQRNERRARNSYDIDNIVIPYSMAASTRVSLPRYKDIAIPKWRIVDDNDESGATTDGVEVAATDASQCSTSSSTVSASERTLASGTDSGSTGGAADVQIKHIPAKAAESAIPPNGTKTITTTATEGSAPVASTSGFMVKTELCSTDEAQQQQLFVMPAQDDEDISEEAIMVKHDRALQEERKKFRTYMKFPWSRPRANRRTESRAGSSGGNTPDPTSPAPPTPMVEQNSSPACPSTPLTPQDGQELSEANVINALNKSLTKKERRRTVSSKRDEQQAQAGGGGSTTPDTREIVSPYESLQFPLADDIYDSMVRSMPNDHIAMVEDCISKLTGRRSRHRNNNVLLVVKSSKLAPSNNVRLSGRTRLSSVESCSSTTMSAVETDLEDFDDEDLMLAKRTANQEIMERLLINSRGESQQYEIVPPTAKPMLGDDEDVLDDEETDTGESLFVEEDDPNDPEWNDRPAGSRSGAAGAGVSGRI